MQIDKRYKICSSENLFDFKRYLRNLIAFRNASEWLLR